MGSIDWGYGITRPSVIDCRRMLVASKEEAGESDSDRAAHKNSDRCAGTSETRTLAKNECSANESDARDHLSCTGVIRRVLSEERTKRVRIPHSTVVQR